MNADDIWSMYLDSYFNGDKRGVRKALASLQALPQAERRRLYDMVVEFENFLATVSQEVLVQTYCDVKGLRSTTVSPTMCRAELVTMLAQAKEVLNG